MMLAYGFKGALAVYLPNGMDEGTYPNESLLTFFMFDDFGAFISWWGVAMATGAIAWLALRERRLPLWIGIVAALFALVPVGFVTATGLPGFPGVIDPFGLVIISAGLAFTFWKQATSRSVAVPRRRRWRRKSLLGLSICLSGPPRALHDKVGAVLASPGARGYAVQASTKPAKDRRGEGDGDNPL